MGMVKRGEVYWVELDPTRGSEIRKTRHARILLDQIRSVDKVRLGKKMGEIPKSEWLKMRVTTTFSFP